MEEGEVVEGEMEQSKKGVKRDQMEMDDEEDEALSIKPPPVPTKKHKHHHKHKNKDEKRKKHKKKRSRSKEREKKEERQDREHRKESIRRVQVNDHRNLEIRINRRERDNSRNRGESFPMEYRRDNRREKQEWSREKDVTSRLGVPNVQQKYDQRRYERSHDDRTNQRNQRMRHEEAINSENSSRHQDRGGRGQNSDYRRGGGLRRDRSAPMLIRTYEDAEEEEGSKREQKPDKYTRDIKRGYDKKHKENTKHEGHRRGNIRREEETDLRRKIRRTHDSPVEAGSDNNITESNSDVSEDKSTPERKDISESQSDDAEMESEEENQINEDESDQNEEVEGTDEEELESSDASSEAEDESSNSDDENDQSQSEESQEEESHDLAPVRSKFDSSPEEVASDEEEVDQDEEEDGSSSADSEDSEHRTDGIAEAPEPSPEEEKPKLPFYLPAIQGCRSVDEFQCLNRIEEGTYGVVYRARDKKTNEVVALKRLKMEKEREGFPITSLREVCTLLKAHHANIVKVQEIVVGSNMDKIYIVMDYVEHDLKSLMETMKQPFLVGEVKTLMIQLLRGIHHLHDNWILHRDLKTSNLLLSHTGILKIGDFGLAREYGSPLKPYTPIVVTLWYRSPELLLGCKEYSTYIDLWSVGCIFAEFLTMKPLFPGKSEIMQLNLIFKELGTPSEKIWPGYNELPMVKKTTFANYAYNNLRKKFGTRISEKGFDLLNRFLTYCPSRRITAHKALDHEWFGETPSPVDPAMFPTWPAKSEQSRAKKTEHSPKAPAGGMGYNKLLEKEDAIAGFQLTAPKQGISRQGMGFNLKF